METNKKIEDENNENKIRVLKNFKNNILKHMKTNIANLKNIKLEIQVLNNIQKGGGEDFEKEKLKNENEKLRNQLILAESILHELKNLK